MAGSEPSDAIRAVNALLTHLDALRRRPNVMVLCTSNLPEAVDVAFVDRADIKVRCWLCPMQARSVPVVVFPKPCRIALWLRTAQSILLAAAKLWNMGLGSGAHWY